MYEEKMKEKADIQDKIDALKVLIEAGADVNIMSGESGHNAVHVACCYPGGKADALPLSSSKSAPRSETHGSP